MGTKTTQWAARSELADERDSRAPSLPTEFLIANLELEFRLTYRKLSPLRISNRKYFAIFYPAATRPACPNRTQWHRQSCLPRGTKGLCAVARSRTRRMANAAISLSTKLRIINRDAISNRDTAIRISPNPHHYSQFEISNRDKMRVLQMALFSVAESRLSQVTPYSKFPAQIDHAAPHAYTGPSAEGESSWKIPSY